MHVRSAFSASFLVVESWSFQGRYNHCSSFYHVFWAEFSIDGRGSHGYLH
jgi:hypothetical protein